MWTLDFILDTMGALKTGGGGGGKFYTLGDGWTKGSTLVAHGTFDLSRCESTLCGFYFNLGGCC